MSREALLVNTLVELADSLVDDFDVVDLLTMLADRCVETLDVTAAGVMLAAPKGDLKVIASSSEAMRVLELFELQADEGPCVDCFRGGSPVVNQRLTPPDGRWPAFTTRARSEGFDSVHALPMRLRGQTIGALNLFCVGEGALSESDLLVAQGFADVATIAILQHRSVISGQTLNRQLGQALTSRIVIEQAKGKISEAAGVSMEEAFQRLRHHARNHNRRLGDLAGDIAGGTLDPEALDTLPVRKAEARAQGRQGSEHGNSDGG